MYIIHNRSSDLESICLKKEYDWGSQIPIRPLSVYKKVFIPTWHNCCDF